MKIFWKRKIADQKDSILDKILEKYNFQTENILGKVRQKQESYEFDMRTCTFFIYKVQSQETTLPPFNKLLTDKIKVRIMKSRFETS